MKKMNWFTSGLILFIIASFISCSTKTDEEQTKKPNIIVILADDLGYGELGSYGQEIIETPQIDKLAQEGMRFTQHYTGAPVCAPARCVLLSGQNSGRAIIRGNDEWGSRGNVWSYRAMLADSTLEGQRPLPDSVVLLPEILKQNGYKTGMIGKWGLGAPHTNSIPTKKGFDYFLGYNCQRIAHTYYPVHLYQNENRIYLGNDTVAPHSKLKKGANPNSSESYKNFELQSYASDVMFDGMINFIEENANKPFFFYWASPIPHVPLQAPQKWVNYYREKIGEEEPYLGNHAYFPNQYPNATYAAMISYLDERVGQLVDLLKAKNIYENTIIIFTSDNGPTYAGGVDANYFNSARPFLNDHGYTKGFLHEGGIKVPFIATWPAKIKANSESDHISYFADILPSILDIAGIQKPENLDGISMIPSLKGENKKQQEHDYIYWEFPENQGQQAVRMGKWKALRKNIKKGNTDIELYDLSLDIQEKNNIAAEFPEIVDSIARIMEKSHTRSENPLFQMEAIGD